jgi:hypothetical protein
VTAYVAKGFGGNNGLTGSFISAATSTLCPKYS